jgi:hypothetical protein
MIDLPEKTRHAVEMASQPGLLRRRPRPTTASACSRETQFSTSGAYFFNHRAHLAQRVIQHRLALAQLRQFLTGGHLLSPGGRWDRRGFHQSGE